MVALSDDISPPFFLNGTVAGKEEIWFQIRAANQPLHGES